MLTEEEIKKREQSFSVCVCFSLSLSVYVSLNVYVLSDDMKYKREKSRRTVSGGAVPRKSSFRELK